ncbi:hypothetical protein [Chryseolinea lacunae]|uniref:Magnesium and cobalt transport protein CorA n=1 Tax=Chryseolinea lacunae TaxID=2801331 RepID=A0ABS1KXQ8_9BACT|nr:hypothetical protein [Chryseolinea lacunae]MBL0743091.1 hypothetical protein [Chryseolinea lacunae]
MFPKDDKRRLYQLIDMFLAKQITASVFCDEFYCSYDLEIDYDTLSPLEYSAFSELEKVSSRFSQFNEDLGKYPGVYYNNEELKQKIFETKEKLKDERLL